MSARTQRTLLAIARTDRTFERTTWRGRPVWLGKCIHCNRRLALAPDGEAISRATVEHIVPRSHGGTDELDNLAVACAGCNHAKGRRIDVLPAGHPKLVAMIERLAERRRTRWRDPDETL